MRTTPDEVVLLARIAVGEEAALELLATSYHTRLWRYLARQVGADAGLIEDVLQEIYLAIWNGARSYRGRARVSTWIFQITHYRVLAARRTRTRRAARARLVYNDDDDDSGAVDADATGAVPSLEDAVLDRLTWPRLCAACHRSIARPLISSAFTASQLTRRRPSSACPPGPSRAVSATRAAPSRGRGDRRYPRQLPPSYS